MAKLGKAMGELLGAARTAMESEIRKAFAGVRRNGVSWSEAYVLDCYGSPEEQKEARSQDLETSWEQLVEDGNWESDPGMGGWSFLDADGFRYYLPAAMIRCLHSGEDEGICFFFTLPVEAEFELAYESSYEAAYGIPPVRSAAKEDLLVQSHFLELWSLLTGDQRCCIKHFLEFMVSHDEAREAAEGACTEIDSQWKKPLRNFWQSVDC